MKIEFPKYSNIRCLMMPYIQGDPKSVPDIYRSYDKIIESVFIKRGDIGYLTIDESIAEVGKPHRGNRAKFGRAIHTEVGRKPGMKYGWGDGGGWGDSHKVTLERNTKILLANNIDDSCAIWNVEHENTSVDGDIGYASEDYPYDSAIFMKAGEVHEIGILTPHESLPIKQKTNRQFLRIIGSGVNGRESYFTINPLIN